MFSESDPSFNQVCRAPFQETGLACGWNKILIILILYAHTTIIVLVFLRSHAVIAPHLNWEDVCVWSHSYLLNADDLSELEYETNDNELKCW